MNKNLLRAKMAEFGDTYKSLAEYLGIAPSTLAKKVNEYKGTQFTQEEISRMKNLYKLTDSEVVAIFFA